MTETIQYREKLPWPPGVRSSLVGSLVLAALVVPAAMSSNPTIGWATRLIPAVVLVLLAAAVWSVTALQIVITPEKLVVGCGPFHEHIARERIIACTVGPYRWQAWGGFGFRLRPEGRLYNVPSDGGQAVYVLLDNGQYVLFSSGDPEQVCAILVRRAS